MKAFVFPILLIVGAMACAAARREVIPLSIPTAPAVNRVAVPAANDPSSNPSDGAAQNTTATASSSVAVVSLTELAHGFKTDRVVATRYVEDDGPDRGRWSIGFTFPSDPNECDRGELCDLITSKGGDIRWCGGFKGAPIRATFPCANDQETVNAKIREVLPELSRLIKEIAGKPSKPAVSGYSPARVAVVSLTPVADVKPGAEAAYSKPPAIASLAVLQFTLGEGCEPCKKAKPTIEQLKAEGFSITDAPNDWNPYGVKSAPTWIVYENGVERGRFAYATLGDLVSLLRSSKPLAASPSLPTAAGDLILCPVCGGHGNICIPGENCGRCPQCTGARVVQVGKHVRVRPAGGFELVQPVKVNDFQVTQKPGGNLIVHNGISFAALEHPRSLVMAGAASGACPTCRGGGKVCYQDGRPCQPCPDCGGSLRVSSSSPSFSALETSPVINFRCDPIAGNLTSDVKAIPQTGCTDCKCFPECHCGVCVCKDAAAKQVSLPSEPPAGYVSKDVLAMLAESNRVSHPRTLDASLCRAAQDYADLLARTHQQGHYADGDPEYRAKRAGFTGSLRQPGKRLGNEETSYGIGEVLAFGHRDIASAFDGWMHSPGHRSAVMEQTFDVVGCGRSGTVWCMMLGNSKVAAAAPPVAQSAQSITQFQTCRPGMPCYQPQQQYQRRGWFGRR